MRTRSYGWGLGLLVAIAALALLASLLIGPADLPLGRALAALSGGGDEMARTIMGAVRVPRSLAAFAVGSLLALAGVLLQALFRNPLADPFVLGVSGGAAVGALSGMLAGAGIALLHWYATAGAFAIGALVLLIGRTSDTTRLLLAGQLRGMVFWLAGDLSWSERPGYDLAVAGIALIAAVLLGRVLNVLASGELRSASLGLAGAPTRLWVFLIASALTGTAVLSAGPVGFVGLVAPHLVRLGFKTADHRIVAPAAALCGGALLCVADVLSRTVAAPRQLPIGAVMALIGAPVFIVLLRRQRSE